MENVFEGEQAVEVKRRRIFNEDWSANADVYAQVISGRITIYKTGVSKLSVMQSIREQVMKYPHIVKFDKKFLEEVALNIFRNS